MIAQESKLGCVENYFVPGWEMVAHAFNPSTQEAETSGSQSLRPAWSIEGVPGQPGLHRETMSQKKKKKKINNKIKLGSGGAHL